MQFQAPKDPRFARLDGYIQQEYIDAGRLAGAQIAIQHRGAMHGACFGFLDKARTRPMAWDCIFRIYSMTKPVTCVATMMLVERGRLRLEDEVSRYIPSWADIQVKGMSRARPMRVVDLLTHCSGLTAGFQKRTDIDALYREKISFRSDGPDLRAFVSELAHFPLEFEPGSAWNYSVSTDVLGYVIQELSGQSLRDFLKSQIFDPLNMSDTDFHVPIEKRARLADCYVKRPTEPLGDLKASYEPDPTHIPTFYCGGGGLFSTTPDYLAFARAILGQGSGSPGLLSGATWRQMSTNHLPGNLDLPSVAQGMFTGPDYVGSGFGLGFATTIDPSRAGLAGTLGDAFWSGMANTFFWCDPLEQMIGIFMTQILPNEAYPLQARIRALAYEAVRGQASKLTNSKNR